MRNIKLTIEYDGTRFYGWQKQPNVITVQEEIEKAINKITGEEIKIIGAGRTDRGVHAKAQVANFNTASRIPADRIKFALNSQLPEDISIKESEEVGEDFHSRYSAVGKEYRYLVYNNKTRSPLLRNYAYYVPYKLDVENIKAASKYFIDTYDFKGFMSSGSSVKDTVRTIYDFSVLKKDSTIEFRIKGNGFLYNMVRIIVGTLIEVGNNKIKVEDIPNIIKSKDRSNAGHTALPQGLYLYRVYYNNSEIRK
ncbi:tRNA pseudouridine(38-40) synthase TruA [Caldisalinibacter kiritimatiensis]|uniref:tRNA pseudouridine synthase A n=1 Tax=Caldisalinibacter kiritimatiensis TaxID=1304284 RepID=R1CWP0_9FIRM|nr:tRNA pseudouridine(38-40) synthase TruA [Caldisalinibacter kiritimatiensis]EOD01024.1 tRNA pseudouridine synthase A [Caldisalinibacter kiritimatiensis]